MTSAFDIYNGVQSELSKELERRTSWTFWLLVWQICSAGSPPAIFCTVPFMVWQFSFGPAETEDCQSKCPAHVSANWTTLVQSCIMIAWPRFHELTGKKNWPLFSFGLRLRRSMLCTISKVQLSLVDIHISLIHVHNSSLPIPSPDNLFIEKC